MKIVFSKKHHYHDGFCTVDGGHHRIPEEEGQKDCMQDGEDDVGAGIALEDFHQEIADVVGYDEGCNWNLWARTLHCMKVVHHMVGAL